MFLRVEKGDYDVFTIRPDGTDVRRATSTPGNDVHMGWSADGEHIVFTSARMGFKDEVMYTNAPQPVRRAVRYARRWQRRAAADRQPVGGRHAGMAADAGPTSANGAALTRTTARAY